MKQTSKPLAFRIVTATLFVLLTGFVVLSVDVVVRVWMLRTLLESGVDAAILLSYESARALTTALAVVLAWISHRRASTAAQRTFTLLLLFLALWYTKSFSFAGFPGHLQELLAGWLFARGISRPVVQFVFGSPVWAAWLALGALLLVSANFPKPLEAATILRSGKRDRTGLLRGTSLAGSDVGALFRRFSAALLEHGGFRPVPVWLATGTAGVLHAVTALAAVRIALAVSFALLAVLAVTNLRAGTTEAPLRERRRALWMLQSTITTVAAFATSALLSMTGDGATDDIAFGLAALAPPVVLMGMSCGITRRRPPNPTVAIERTFLTGIAAVSVAAIFVLFTSVARSLTQVPFANAAGALFAATLTILLWTRIRSTAARLSSSIVARA